MPPARSGRMRRPRRCSSAAIFTSPREVIESTLASLAGSSPSIPSSKVAGMQSTEVDAPLKQGHDWSRAFWLAIGAAILIGSFARLNLIRWAEPCAPHQPDEHILPLEALALWEGITPREVGWPGSTS